MRSANNKQYLGNKSKKEVHDLDKTKPNCEIDKIKEEHKVYFNPDTLDQAHKDGYDNCAHCIGNSKH
jgi:hypothetical protein